MVSFFNSVLVRLKTPRSLENTHTRRHTDTHAQSEDFGNSEKSQRQSANLTNAVFIFTNLIPTQIGDFKSSYCVSNFVEKSGSFCFPYTLIPFFPSLLTSTCVFLIMHALTITDDTSKHSLSVRLQVKWTQTLVHMLDTLGRVSRQTSRLNQVFTFTALKHFEHVSNSLVRISRRVQRDGKKR